MWAETETHAVVISDTNKWLNNFHRSYCKKIKIKEKKEPIFSGELPIKNFYKNQEG